MKYEKMMGLEILDDDLYARYRAAMLPILQAHGGGFRYDFKVAETLKNYEGRAINRVFALYCDSKERMDAFFSNADYLKVKAEFFVKSVGDTTILSEYDIEL